MAPHRLISQDSYDKVFFVGASSLVKENGFLDTTDNQEMEKTIDEFMQESPIKATDDHLIEFAEAMRTVAKVLRRAAEAKAAAQAEAAEWKRKYEFERASNLQNTHEALPFESDLPNSGAGMLNTTCDETRPDNATVEQSKRCYRKHGICTHEILQDEPTDSSSKFSGRKVARKASFKLSWGCNGEKCGQQKHEIVSFGRGDIATVERSSKQILLKWETQPKSVFILTKPDSESVRALCAEMVRWLKNHKKIDVFVEPQVRSELLREASFFEFVQTWENDEGIKLLHSKVDLVVTLGDRTVLWSANSAEFEDPLLRISLIDLLNINKNINICSRTLDNLLFLQDLGKAWCNGKVVVM